ncbi:type I-E CRISPR-associated protein Cas6/Cse3/CasE [Asticcacaulis sp. AC402]|uniref:type I-E CRISPR-associated protein Cas6/Cse3/CasE n=1 Tax=Asticcacaulis sp. AC402 TaxID=1282361 RepID=UPI0003C3BBE7|nr:type I-E CRISPR-associated protein Cas6/Cse3/CasE [Asticcacaulis sp. AC402]ESQ74766.1 hypothetical protein ABAC402_12740 [Asticcacaulis sp. AC402]
MSFFTLAQLRHDTQQARAFARQAHDDPKLDGGHRLIWRLFAEDPEAKRDFIFRLSERGRFLIVSERQPVFDDRVWEIRTKPYAPSVSTGQRYGFGLRVNPTIAVSQADRKPSLRVDVLMRAKRDNGGALTAEARETVALDWLGQKLSRCGAVIDPAYSQVLDYAQIHPPRKASRTPATISVIDAEGVLTVSDPVHLQRALLSGIGHGKAFGLGLLLLRPLGA